ncbi:MAG: ABC transporter permease [Acidimicrobiales bacterium]
MRRAKPGVALGFLAGLALCVLGGKGVAGAHLMASVVPNGIFLQGIVLGALNGLLAIGLVLIYRSNRIINFAQGTLGAFSATMAAELYERFNWPFFAALAVGLVAAVASSALIEIGVIRRFSKAPRLILTVATIGVAQVLGALELIVPAAFNDSKGVVLRHALQTPISFQFSFGGVIFTGNHVAVLIATPLVLGGLAWFLRRTGYGLAARAAAENADRARLLGVRVKRVSLIVWVVAGGLSAVTAILSAPITGFELGSLGGFTLLLSALAAAVIGRMESLPVTFAAAVVLSTAQQAIYFGTGGTGPDNGFLLAVVIIGLLVQRRRLGRLEGAGNSSTWQAVQEVRPIPRELSHLPEIRWARLGLAATVLGVLIGLPFVLLPSRIDLASVIMIYAMVALSLVVLTGWSGNVSLGQWALVGVGGLVAGRLATLAHPVDFFVTLLAGGVAGALAALLIGLPALRIPGLFLAVTTLAFAQATGNWLFGYQLITPNGAILRPVLFGLWDVSSERGFYFVCLIFLVASLLVVRNLRRSRLGRVLVSVRDNERQAQALGASAPRAKLTAFAVSGFLAALAGGLYGYHEGALNALRFPASDSLLIFSMVVIGGMGSMTGAVLGAVYVRGVQYFLPAEFQLLATGFGLLILLWAFPGGLGQLVYMARDRYLRWVAERRGLIVPSLLADRRLELPLGPPDGPAGSRPAAAVPPSPEDEPVPAGASA